MRLSILLPSMLAMSLVLPLPSLAQAPRQPHAGEIALGLRRLGVVGSVLYVAAHPDDENTHLLAYLVGARGLRTGYLSLTRGDGGQNLIGTEQDALLGLLRTQELLAARRIDGAEQLFTRARDFGYSKSAEEALRLWGHDEVLADVVLAIRRFRPDVMITRFTPEPPNHGHHTASARLAEEAFAAAADPTRFPEQLAEVKPWKVNRLLYNLSTWGLPKNADLSAYAQLDVGDYEPLLGRSYGEVAAQSRSQHQSQGFGVPAERGPSPEYFTPVLGVRPKGDPLEGLELGWKRLRGAEAVERAVQKARDGFDARRPELSIPALLEVHSALGALASDDPWRAIKLQETQALIAACAGLFLDVRAATPAGVPGTTVKLDVTALNRSHAKVRLVSVAVTGAPTLGAVELAHHAPFEASMQVALPEDASISTPYWLRTPARGALFGLAAPDRGLIGRPEGPPALSATFVYELSGKRFTEVRPVLHAWTDPVRGELYRAFEIAPAVTASLDREGVMFPNASPQGVSVEVTAGKSDVAGKVRLELPAGWASEPASHAFQLSKAGDERTVGFRIVPPKTGARPGTVKVWVDVAGKSSSWRAREVTHAHIPPQTVRQASEAALVPFPLTLGPQRLGYIPGPGDKVAESLSAVGYQVTLLPEPRLAGERLEQYAAILVGVRAFNANPRLLLHRERLLRYVEQGGRLVLQYNTNNWSGPLTASLGPYPFEIGRGRVTDEAAAVTPLAPDEPLLHKPNPLGAADWQGWVQERGLYFASTWDSRYRAVLRMNDPQEAPVDGALLVARHGKGTFVYTGLSFFRQLPAGVPGAYRLLANLLTP